MTTETKNRLLRRPRHIFTKGERKVLVASSVGTIFEWYDFYLYGVLSPALSKHFFSNLDENSAFIFTLLAFAAGFVVRPIGAAAFGRLGDISGRKYTFLITIIIMGLTTFAIGFIPDYQSIGIVAPIILVCLRIIQGLAVGGEYGGAVIYVAEHSPNNRRGKFTGWIQITAIAGLLISSVVVLTTRWTIGEDAFSDWGWRVPFLLSLILLIVSVWIRLSLSESPIFTKMKAEGRNSKKPLSEAFGQWKNLKLMLVAVFGLMTGNAVISTVFLTFMLLFLLQTLKVDYFTANLLFSIAAIFTIFCYIVLSSMSDQIGRKKMMMTGMLLASITVFPIFKGITHFANPALELAQQNSPVYVTADPQSCHFQFNPTGTVKFTSSCDIAKAKLISAGVNYKNVDAAVGSVATITIGGKVISSYDADLLSKSEIAIMDKELMQQINTTVRVAGYPEKADPSQINKPMLLLLMCILGLYAGLVYAPLAATLVEFFPTRIRYTAMSIPYHVGYGWFGGLFPAIAFALATYAGDMYYGLWYAVIVGFSCFVIGTIFVKETKGVDINYDDRYNNAGS